MLASGVAAVRPATNAAAVLRPADIFLTRGTGLFSRLIRFCTRAVGESRTMVNHVGVVVAGGPLEAAVVVEALSTVKRHRLWDQYGGSRDEVAVFRPRNLSAEEIKRVTDAALDYEGRHYGWVKLLAHLLDWALLGVYLFRRLASMDKYPICSWLVAHAFGKISRDFGVDPGAATPDDIWDHIREHPEAYKEIHSPARLSLRSVGPT